MEHAATSPEQVMGLPQVRDKLRMARIASQHGEFDRCVGIYDSLLGEFGPHPEILHFKAQALLTDGRPGVALQAISSALKLDQARAALHATAAQICVSLTRMVEARRHALEAVRLEPRNAEVLCGAGSAFRASGDHERATRVADRATASDPGFADAWRLKAILASDLGRAEEAESTLARALSLKPDDSATLGALAQVLNATLEDEDMVTVLEAHRSGAVPSVDRSPAIFALAAMHAGAGRHEEAFTLYEEANLTQAREAATPTFPIEAFEEGVDAVIRFHSDWQPPDFSPAKEPSSGLAMAFIVGMPRSGSTLLEQMLSMHSEVAACGPGNGVRAAERSLEERGLTPLLLGHDHSPTRSDLARARSHYLDNLPLGHENRRVGIDSNLANFQRVPLMAGMFPDARIIHLTRHPLDSLLACFFHRFDRGMGYTQNIERLARYIAAYSRLMAHWTTMFPQSIVRVSYEDLVTDPQAQLRSLCQFLNLEWEGAVLNYRDNPRPVGTPSTWEVRRPLHREGISMWHNYREPLAPVLDYLATIGILDENGEVP